MDIKELIAKTKRVGLEQEQFAVFGSAVMAVRGMREAPNIDIIVTDKQWIELLKTDKPDDEGFIRRGPVKISNWWFAPTKKPLPQLIKEAEMIDGLPFVQIENVLDYKIGLQSHKDIRDVEMINNYLTNGAQNLGMETYQPFVDAWVEMVEENLGDKILSMVLFGSACRGQAKGDSDLDIFTFFDDEKISREKVNDKLTALVLDSRRHLEYEKLAMRKIYPEVYPFLISKSKADDLLPVFLDVADHGMILKDAGIAEKLIKRIKEAPYQRAVLPNGKWVWTNL